MEKQNGLGNTNYTFDICIKIFIEHIESLANSLPTVLSTIGATHQKATKVHQKFLENDCEKREEDGKSFYLVKPEHKRRNGKLRKEVIQSAIAHQIIQRNYIVSLVSQFDSFIGSLIRTIYLICPEILNQSEKKLTFANLVEFETIEEAREYIIEKEIETVLRGSHTNHFEWFEKKLGTSLRKDLDSWPTFIELTQRRNLFVHNNGVVSNQYLNVCKENNVKLDSDLKIGDRIIVEPEYFDQAFKCVFELGIKLSQVIRRRLLPKNLEDADRSILNISFELIQNNQYDLAKQILDFCEKYIREYSSDDFRLRLILNHAQTYKWQGNSEKCKEIVNSHDWSASSNIFKLASQVLLDDYENAVRTMRIIGKNGEEIDKMQYKEWPIFREFRKQKMFRECYEEVFEEPFEIKEAIAESGFKIIDEKTFLDFLDESLNENDSKTNWFLSSKYFVEKKLAQKGYDIASSWTIFNKLVDDGVIESYPYEDETGKYLPVSSVRRK